MDEAQLILMARVWADEMSDVPLEAVEELHRRVMKARKAPYCPNVGDYRAAWNEWDYWAEVNSVERNDYLALPAAMAASDTPRFVKLFQLCGPVMCKCPETVSANGVYVYPSMAQLMTVGELIDLGRDANYKGLDFTGYGAYTDPCAKDLPRYWVCAEGKCDFCVDANRLDEVLPPRRPEQVDAVLEVIASVGHPARVADESTDDEVADPLDITDAEVLSALTACGCHVERIGAERSIEFGRFIIRQLGVAGLNEQDAKTLWPEFKAQAVEATA